MGIATKRMQVLVSKIPVIWLGRKACSTTDVPRVSGSVMKGVLVWVLFSQSNGELSSRAAFQIQLGALCTTMVSTIVLCMVHGSVAEYYISAYRARHRDSPPSLSSAQQWSTTSHLCCRVPSRNFQASFEPSDAI